MLDSADGMGVGELKGYSSFEGTDAYSLASCRWGVLPMSQGRYRELGQRSWRFGFDLISLVLGSLFTF